jgi:hypothetical protein
MGVLQQIPKTLAFSVWNNSSEIPMGRFKPQVNSYLKNIWSRVYINGNIVGSERIRINIKSDNETLIFQSAWSNISDIEDLSEYWLGFIRLDFNGYNISKEVWYNAYMEIENYTRIGDTFYIGVSFDFPFPTYDLLATDWKTQPLSMKIFSGVEYGL